MRDVVLVINKVKKWKVRFNLGCFLLAFGIKKNTSKIMQLAITFLFFPVVDEKAASHASKNLYWRISKELTSAKLW